MLKNVKAECKPITNIDSIIIRLLDRGQKVIASSKRFSWLRFTGLSFPTVSGVMDYALSPLVDTSRIITMYDSAQTIHIRNISETEFRTVEPGPTDTGDSYVYRLIGYSPVQYQPTSASVLTFVSSSTADTTQTISVQGFDASSILQTEVITLNGTTPVLTTASFTRVLSLSKSDFTTGKVTVTSNAGAVTNVVISAYNRAVTHPVVSLYSIPGGVHTIYYDFDIALPSLKVGTDISLIPEKYHDVIELYAKYNVFKHINNTNMSQIVQGEYQFRINQMMEDDKRPFGVHTLNDVRGNSTIPTGTLGPNFPNNGSGF